MTNSTTVYTTLWKYRYRYLIEIAFRRVFTWISKMQVTRRHNHVPKNCICWGGIITQQSYIHSL